MNRSVISKSAIFKLTLPSVLAAATLVVACMSVNDAPGVAVEKTPTDADAAAEGGSSRDGAASSACAAHTEDGATFAGCCLLTGRCGYFVPSLNACTDPVQLGLEESTSTCVYEREDDDEEDDDKDKDKDGGDDDDDD